MDRRHGRRRRVVADPGPGQSALQEMAESGDVNGAGLGRRPVMVVMVDTVHQPALDLPAVRLPLAIQRVVPAGCNVMIGTIKR